MIRIIEGARAVFAAGSFLVCFLREVARNVVQVREGWAKYVVGSASKGARRVHGDRMAAEVKEGMVAMRLK